MILMAKTKADKSLYGKLRDNGVRKKVANRVSEALPIKGSKKPSKAHKIADELSAAADSIRERAGGGSRKRSEAAKKAARTRKANAAKRRSSARKGAKTRRSR
jgi:hypothetical protein